MALAPPPPPQGWQDKGLMKRLYGTIFLLNALNDKLVDFESSSGGPRQVRDQGAKDVYETFVNKLGHICDVRHGGGTVTAVVVLETNNGIEYCFTSNDRTRYSFEQARRFLAETILGVLGSTSDEHLADKLHVSNLRSTMLRRVLGFNRWRIHTYIKSLIENIGDCIASCRREGTPEALSILQDLRNLQRLGMEAQEEWPDAVRFAQSSHILLDAIASRYDQGLERFLGSKTTNNTQERNLTSWGHVRHVLARMQSYSIAMLVLVEARRRWPELFQSFEVRFIPSAAHESSPMQMKADKCTGENILRCIIADEATKAAYKALNQNLLMDIDAKVREQIKSKDFYTLMHAEVRLVDHLIQQQHQQHDRVRFFREGELGRYVGCSKPTCLLCDLFLDEHPLGVGRRKAHRNLYPKWRVPANTDRTLVEELARRLKRVLAYTIVQRTALWNRYDSSHNPSDPFRRRQHISLVASVQPAQSVRDDESEFAWEEGLDELDDLMSQLELDPAVQEGLGDAPVVYEVEVEDSDGEVGGATL